MRAYDLDGLGRHNFEQIAEDLLKNHESIGWERRNYKQVMACAAGRGLADGSHGGAELSELPPVVHVRARGDFGDGQASEIPAPS